MQHGGKYATLFHICKMANFSVISVNVQGLGNFQKRRDVFHYLRQKNHSIYFLQGTHFTKKKNKLELSGDMNVILHLTHHSQEGFAFYSTTILTSK
jgi:exonuclease III